VQELMPSMKDDLVSRISDYSIFGNGRSRKLTDEHSAVLLHDGDCEMKSNETFWLSKHPKQCGSRAYYAVFPRICTVCEVYSMPLNQKMRIYNTHLDHICGPARTLGVNMILEYMHRLNQIEKLPIILMGDMNAAPDAKPIRILTDNLHKYEDIHLNSIYSHFDADKIINTYHGFTGKQCGVPIDYIFVSDEFKIRNAYVDTTNQNGRYPSDHFPLVAELELK
jgi:endonuclease/exonuclease/phosphatase family metal-dependent hydrolase